MAVNETIKITKIDSNLDWLYCNIREVFQEDLGVFPGSVEAADDQWVVSGEAVLEVLQLEFVLCK